MSIFSWKSGFHRLLGHRRHQGYTLPLALWGFVFARALFDGPGRPYLWSVWPILILSLWVGTGPIAAASVESTARWRGVRPEELELGTGVRWFLGLTDREPWWVTWSVLACWVSFPMLLAMMLVAMVVGGGAREVQAALAGVLLAGFLAAFLLAPVVRALAGRREAAGDARPAGEDRPA